MLIFRLRRFARRITPLTWIAWAFLAANIMGGAYGRFDFVVVEIDAADFISVIRTGKHHDSNSTQPN